MVSWLNRRTLGWLSLLLGVVGFTLPWAWYGVHEEGHLFYHMWNGWLWVAGLFVPYFSPISPLVAGVELFPLIGAIAAIIWPDTRRVWWWAVATSLSLLSLGFHVYITLDSEQGFLQSTEPVQYGPGLYIMALGIAFLIVALWPWQVGQRSLAIRQPEAM